MGLGLHGGGVATAKFFVEQGAQVTVTDLKIDADLTLSLEELRRYDIRYVLGRHEEEDFKKADLIIQNPGVPSDSHYLKIAQKYKIPILTDIGIFFELCPSNDIIGITGTKGKSTTASLIYKIIKGIKKDVILAGNIRLSPLSLLENISSQTTIVLELSSWQLEGLAKHKKSPHIAVITNIYPDHLNAYKTMADYIQAKELIFKFQKQQDYIILNYDNEVLKKHKFLFNLPNAFWFSRSAIPPGNGAYLDQKKKQFVFQTNGFAHTIVALDEVRIQGEHNLENVLAAICASAIWGVKRSRIADGIRSFNGLADRMELIEEIDGIKYYNDTTATMPEASMNAVRALKSQGKIILIAGGADKGLIYKEWAKVIFKLVKSIIFLKGSATDKMIKELKKIAKSQMQDFKVFDSMAKAVQSAQGLAKKGDIVLLSPGAASFGFFQHEFDRGEQFKACVSGLR